MPNASHWGSVNRKIAKAAYKLHWDLLAAAQHGRPPRIEVAHERQAGLPYAGLEYIHRCAEPAFIEPEWGYVITGRGQLLQASLQPNDTDNFPPWRQGLPSPTAFRKVAQQPTAANVISVPAAISLRHWWEWNYFHFYNDVLGKLHLLETAGVPSSIPLVLGKYADELPFVRQIISRGELGRRQWIIQDEKYVRAETIYYCRTKEAKRERFGTILALADVPTPALDATNRLFLTRSPKATRRVENNEEVIAVVGKYGFEVVDTEGMSIARQMELFAGTRYLIMVHGAGFTNIMYRQTAPLSILELHADNYLTKDPRDLAETFGHGYNELGGKAAGTNPQHANYQIDPSQLALKIEQMLNG